MEGEAVTVPSQVSVSVALRMNPRAVRFCPS
jgi:hypothetical protein